MRYSGSSRQSFIRGLPQQDRPNRIFTGSDFADLPPLDELLSGQTRLPRSGPQLGGAPLQQEYDPVTAQYQQSPPAYEPPSPWFEGIKPHPTPEIRLRAIPVEQPGAVSDEPGYEDSAMTAELFQQLMGHIPPLSRILCPSDADPTMEMIALAHKITAEQAMAGSDDSALDAAMQEISQAIEAQSMPEPVDPNEMMQQMYDQQHELMMNPPMMPGPG